MQKTNDENCYIPRNLFEALIKSSCDDINSWQGSGCSWASMFNHVAIAIAAAVIAIVVIVTESCTCCCCCCNRGLKCMFTVVVRPSAKNIVQYMNQRYRNVDMRWRRYTKNEAVTRITRLEGAKKEITHKKQNKQ